MKMQAILLLPVILLVSLTTAAQTTQHTYTYDDNGNRTARNTVYLTPKVANPNQSTTLAGGLTQEQIAAGATLAVGQEVILNAYPNPATEQVTISLSTQAEAIAVVEARLYSANCSAQAIMQNPGSNFTVHLEGLPAGNYTLWLKLSNGTIERVRVVKL
jgi:hypothetical protein